MRALALYLASYIDTWPDLIAQHQKTLTELPSSSDTATILQFVAPRLLAHLENSERKAVATQNMLLHSLAQHGLESLRAQTVVGQHSGQQVLEKLSTAPPATQSLIHAYYLLHLRGDALTACVGLTDKEIIPALCRARTELDWLNKTDVWQVADGEYLFPSLITDYFSGRIDKDSEKLLVDTISKDLSRLVGFERQWRIHLLLSAAYTSLPFPPSRSDSQASNAKQKGITLGESSPRSGPRLNAGSSATKSARLTVGDHSVRSPSYAAIYIAGGCLVLAGIFALLLLSNSSEMKPAIETPELTSQNTTITPSLMSSDSHRENEIREKDNNPPVIKPTNFAQQTPTIVAPAEKIVPVIGGPNENTPAVNIMPLIDVARDAISGNWKIKQQVTLNAQGDFQPAILQFPTKTPREYELLIAFARLKGDGELAVIVSNHGVQAAAIIGLGQGKIAGFSLVDGKAAKENATSVRSLAIKEKQKYIAKISVRKNKMQLFLDGQLITTWETTSGELTSNSFWGLRDKSAIGLGVKKSEYAFYNITMRDLSSEEKQESATPSLTQSTSTMPSPSVKNQENHSHTPIKIDLARQGYLTVRDSAFIELANAKNTVARKIITDAISNPTYATFINELQLDLSCITLADENLAAIIVGAKSLINIYEYTIEEKSGTKILLGRSHDNQIKSVNDSGLNLETKFGNGYLHRDILFIDLSPATRAGLARDAQKNKPDAELRALVGSMLQQKPDTKPENIIYLRAWARKASAKEGQAALAAHLDKQINEHEKMSLFDQRLRDIELQAHTNDPETLVKPLADLAKEMTESTNNAQVWQRHKNVSELLSKRQGDIITKKADKSPAEAVKKAPLAVNEKVIYEWDFTQISKGPWNVGDKIVNLNVVNGTLSGEIIGSGSFIIASNLAIPVTDAGYIEIRLRGTKEGFVALFFKTTTMPTLTWAARLPYIGNEFVTLRFDVTTVNGFNHDLTLLRIDPLVGSDTQAKFEIQSIKILRE